MKILVCGGRDYDDFASICHVLRALRPSTVIEGGARGADAPAGRWARDNEVNLIVVHADWTKHGRAAGHIRNGWMLDERPEIVVAFPGGRGTDNCVKQARARGIPVLRVEP